MNRSLPPARIILVSFNSARFLPACLDSLLAQTYPAPVRIHVVDNGSKDETAAVLAGYAGRIEVDPAGRNLGFPRAVNRALEKATEEIIVLLNPDTEMAPDWLSELVGGLLSSPEIGLAGSLLLFPDGSVQHAGGRVYANGLTGHAGVGERPNPPGCAPMRVDYATGAALAVRREHLLELGGLDEGYPMYGEDVQLAVDLARRGLSCVVVPSARGLHHESVGSRRDSLLYLYRLHRARLRWSFLNFPLSHLLGRFPGEEFYYLRVSGAFSTYRFWPVLAAYARLLVGLPRLWALRRGLRLRVRDPRAFSAYLEHVRDSGIRALAEEWRRRAGLETRRA